MYTAPIGVSILTNANRAPCLWRCLQTLLDHTAYRPLVIGIYDNGSTDDTWKRLQSGLAEANRMDGLTWRIAHSDTDTGCAAGTNASIAMVEDCELQLHLESDFYLLPPDVSGCGPAWLQDAAAFLDTADSDGHGSPSNYLYLRRIRDQNEMMMHWWSQWHANATEAGHYAAAITPGFWWSNNPALFNLHAMRLWGTLPLAVAKDGPKGTAAWSVPELTAPRPPGTWIHRWGMFAHETDTDATQRGCGIHDYGKSGCKYGFFVNPACQWCNLCDLTQGPHDMAAHEQRYRAHVAQGGAR